MIPGLNPRKMQQMMRQLGMNQEQIDASKVIIEKTDSTKIIIENPSVSKISMQGQETFQVSGEITEENTSSEEDIKTIIEKTQCTETQARQALEETGDLAEAILELSK